MLQGVTKVYHLQDIRHIKNFSFTLGRAPQRPSHLEFSYLCAKVLSQVPIHR